MTEEVLVTKADVDQMIGEVRANGVALDAIIEQAEGAMAVLDNVEALFDALIPRKEA